MGARRRVLVACALPLAAAWPDSEVTPARAPDFVHDVLPLLQRQGCASAYCHGAATGQGGFKLSLFGSDPRADHAAITRALGGRRIDLGDPDASLILQKPLRQVAHGGGKRLTEGGDEHRRLRAWIDAGAGFENTPPRRLAALRLDLAGDRLRAAATFAAGADVTEVDVTALATFSTSDERVATVDRSGSVNLLGPGEAYLFARYAGTSARVALLRPFAAGTHEVGAASAHALDRAAALRWSALGLVPAAMAAPATLARRLYLDLLERPPSALELQRFASLPESERVARTADALLGSPGFVDVATRRLLAMLEAGDDPRPAAAAARSGVRARVHAAVAADEALPDLTRDLLRDAGPFLTRFEDPRDRAELVGRTLLGVRIGCARCHDHPNDRWKQSDHLAFAACFAAARPRPEAMAGGTASGSDMAASSLYDLASGAAVAPRLLPLPRRAASADLHAFVHDRAHDLFARAFTNRVFAWLLGQGLVEPLDDHRDTNPARHEAWLTALQDTFHAHGQRLRPLVRAIVTSRVYQSASAGGPLEEPDRARALFLAQRTPKQLDGVVLRGAMAAALGVEAASMQALPESPLRRRLALVNGDDLARALSAPGNTVDVLTQLGGSPREQLDELFVACLTRPPTAAEHAALLPALETDPTALRALAGALLLSREFEFLR